MIVWRELGEVWKLEGQKRSKNCGRYPVARPSTIRKSKVVLKDEHGAAAELLGDIWGEGEVRHRRRIGKGRSAISILG